MYHCDFVIPLNREELCESRGGEYYVAHSYSIPELREKLEEARTALAEEGTDFIFDHFATFFSLFQKFKDASELIRQKGWVALTKSFTLLSNNLSVILEDASNIDSEVQSKMCNMTKMIVYALIELMKLYQDKYTDNSNCLIDAKGKKKQIKPVEDGWDYIEERHKVLVEIYNFLQLPLKFLWEPPVVDEEFVNLVANYCYKCLENQSIGGVNMKPTRDAIFEILGLLIKQYLHGLSFCVKVVQLLRTNEHLVNPLSQGVVRLVKDLGCNNLIKEIVREIADTDGDQLVADSGGTRSLNLFLVQLAEAVPEMIIPAIDLLLHHLDGDSYTMRICVLGVLGEIVQTTLTKENLDDNLKKMRDEFLDCLEDHYHDNNAFVRTKVLQVWQKLCSAKAIPISRLNHLLDLTVGRLNDKSTNVKKQAVHLIKDLLEGNPYSGQLKVSEIKLQLKEELDKLQNLKNSHKLCAVDWSKLEPKIKSLIEELDDDDSEVKAREEEYSSLEEALEKIGNHLVQGDYEDGVLITMSVKNQFQTMLSEKLEEESDSLVLLLRKIYEQRINSLIADIPLEAREKMEKHQKTITYLEDALQFAILIDKALPIILTFLDSNVTTDVLESIHFFTAAYLFGFQQALEGVRKMLHLVFCKEQNVQNAVSTAYKEIYFQRNSSGRQYALSAVKNLSELVLKLNQSQIEALEQVVKQWVKEDIIDKNCIQVMFEKFSMKIPGSTDGQSWAALVLIRMVGAEEPKVIKSNISVLLNQGLGDRGYNNFLIAKETCKTLRKLIPPKLPGKPVDHTLRYERSHEIFGSLYKLLRDGLWNLQEPYYIPMMEEAINLVFILCNHPDQFSEELIRDLHQRIVDNKPPVRKAKVNGKILSKNGMIDEHLGLEEEEKQDEEDENEAPPVEEESEDAETKETALKSNTILLARFISILGQVAVNYVLYLEGPILDELKRRNQVDYEKRLKKFQENKKVNFSMRRGRLDNQTYNDSAGDKNAETGVEDFEFNRVAADDMDAEEMKKKTEKEIVTGKQFLAKYSPLILTICKNPGKFKNSDLQNATMLTLAKFMHVSSVFCEENLQLLVTICEKSPCPERRSNAIISLGALQYRFPNCLEPWTPYMYGMLRDPTPSVRVTSIGVITDLIVNEMIKARSYISNLAICVVDKDTKIAQIARHFFREYSQKGNSLYNVLPTLISNLTQTESLLTEDEFRTVMKFILSLITKDKQSEYLVEKLCQYFESALTERQWSDLAYCLSLLNYTEKALRKILENLRCFANKLYLADVFEAFCLILTNAKRNPQKDKTLITEIEDAIKHYRDKSCQDRNVVFTTVKKKCPPSTRKRVVRRQLLSSGSEDEKFRSKKGSLDGDEDLWDDDDDDAFLSDTSSKKLFAVKGARKKLEKLMDKDQTSDTDDCPRKQPKKVKSRQTQGKRNKTNYRYSDDTSDDESEKKKPVYSTRKRRR